MRHQHSRQHLLHHTNSDSNEKKPSDCYPYYHYWQMHANVLQQQHIRCCLRHDGSWKRRRQLHETSIWESESRIWGRQVSASHFI